MRSIKVVGAILFVGGIVVLLSSFLVELTALSDDPGLGLRQILGIVTGSGAAIAGMVLILGRRRETIVVLNLLGIVLFVSGIVVLSGSLLVDLAGFCTNPGFGLRQIAGTITGALAMSFGVVTLSKTKIMA